MANCDGFPACDRSGCGRPACDHENEVPHRIIENEVVVCPGHVWPAHIPIPPEFQGGGGSSGGGGASGGW